MHRFYSLFWSVFISVNRVRRSAAVPNLGLIEDFGAKQNESHDTIHHIADTSGIFIQLFLCGTAKKKKKTPETTLSIA